MNAYAIKRERWPLKLAPQLVGKAQQAYAVMAPDEAMEYDNVKRVIDDITGESYWQRFQALTQKTGETSCKVGSRLRDLADKWLKESATVEEVKDLIILEQLVNTLPGNIQVWVKERKPVRKLVSLLMIMFKHGSSTPRRLRRQGVNDQQRNKPPVKNVERQDI